MVARFVMKFKKQRIISIIAVVTMAIVLSFVFVACNKTDGKDPGDKDLIEPPKKELSASEIYRQVNPSVAFVLIENLSGYSSGSGFFIDSNGTLITNYHVIDDGLSGAIQLYDGTVATIDSVIGYDKKLDIAILSTSAKNTSPVKIADSIIQIGETVYAIGYPEAFKLGFSSSTFTSGMVSMNRSIEGYSYIQSTVNITHGNSGGALINKYGEVVGITTSGITYANIDYMNLSIPIQRIDTVSRTANEPLVIVTRRKYPVYATFYSDGAKYTTQTLSYEGRASVPTAPVKAGYTLDGWYADSSFTEKFDFNKKITSDVSIYAKWSVATYTIDYNLNSGSWNGSSPSTTYTLNDCGYALPVPTREGYIFEGWKNLSGNFISNYPDVNHLRNLSLYASWVEGTEGLMFSTYYTNYASVTGYNGNADNVVIPKTYRGIPVKIIEDRAFSFQTRIKSVTIPDSVTSLGQEAFVGCTGLTSVTIGNGVTSIGDYAFNDCGGLTSITIPDSVTSIGWSAFKGCIGLTSITIPNNVTSIGTEAFRGCTGLTSVTIPDSVMRIGGGAFYGCSGLTSIVIPDGVTSIGGSAFSGCAGLTSVTIGNGVTSIGDYAFYNCTGLTSITIPDSVTSIGDCALSGCSSLESITIPFIGTKAGVTSSDTYQYPFGYIFGTSSYTGSVATKQYYYGSSTSSATSSTYYIPSSLKSVTITGGNILYNAFSNCSRLTNVTIGNGVTSIGDSAFKGCTGLTSVTIGNSVTSIDEYAFFGCSGLSNIIVDKVNTKYHSAGNCLIETATKTLISGCKTSIIPSDGSVTSIGRRAFLCCTGLTSVTIPDSVTSIGYSAFEGCTGLTSITIPDSVTSIGNYALSGCSSLESITIPFVGAKAGVTSSDAYQYPFGYIFGTSSYTGGVATKQIYYGNSTSSPTSSTTYYIPSSLKSVTVTGGNILYGAFYNCSRLVSITIPDSVTNIGGAAFSNTAWYNNQPNGLVYAGNVAYEYKGTMPSNTSIVLKEGTLGIADFAFRCTGLTSVTIPDSVTSIGVQAFADCTGLTSVTIPDSVTSIGRFAFQGCSGLTSVTIGKGVTSIGNYAFEVCTGLTTINFNGTITQWKAISKGTDWKYKVPSACKVVCTDGTVSI